MADSKMFAKSGGEWVPVYPDPDRGAAPTLSATPAATEIVYTWTAAGGLTVASYEFDFDGVIANVGNVLTVTKTGLTTGSSHTARVRAKSDENVRGPWSNLLTTVAAVPFNVATGGTVTDVPNYNGTGETWRVHTFLATDTFTVTSGSQPFRAYVQGGGGGGGSRYTLWHGGGGDGGYGVLNETLTIPVGAHTVTVGGGGAATGDDTRQPGGTGGASSIGSLLTANGGPGGPSAVSGGNFYTGTTRGLNTNIRNGVSNVQYGSGGVGGENQGGIGNAAANTGNGGQGAAGGAPPPQRQSGAGGSGIVVIAYRIG